MDERPKLAEAFARLKKGEGPLWITWQGRRMLIALPDEAWLAAGQGSAIVATRRGYVRYEFITRRADRHSDSPKLRTMDGPYSPGGQFPNSVADKRIRAVILEEHER